MYCSYSRTHNIQIGFLHSVIIFEVNTVIEPGRLRGKICAGARPVFGPLINN